MAFDGTRPVNHNENRNDDDAPSFKACYQVENINLYLNALAQLPEFARGKATSDAVEEYLWLAPINGLGAKQGGPVATIRLSGQTLEIHSESRKGIQALRVLIEELGGSKVRLVSSTSASGSI
jgi:hypothetical protein